MSKSYQDKESGLWKWGSNGKPMYETKAECDKAGLKIIFDRLMWIKEKINKASSGK